MNTHPLRWDALVFGVLFALVVAGWAALTYDVVSVDDLAIAGPVALIIAGVAGIALTLRRKP
ncbi:hypothetical protein GL325_07685 [Aeromicrobium sp. 636]|uniref:Uncharacterized protein n=1 Tax=Aeromicrobium senzhongii TaxID=2663859 RepID=A0A8I0K2R2_9ACTN|nr:MULTISPECIES: hypothetical protein [Aeromicrobium]MBC9226195.1 hypothetical protein [Aeromicrobium senzhongii]MCQ3998301.1 hypothetical protein [Aeromicrobium sp. 636]MTB88730.1 hypothetical protein [Aeromicrobium senzhongii]QNL93971.1 hypothetical protein H9L21_12855 [Aeromicrobium senzhongii]